MSSTTHEIKFKELSERNKKASENAIKVNAQIENAHDNHKKLQKIAVEKFGTSDLTELNNLYKQWTEQNEASLTEFETQILSLEKEVESKNQIIKQIQQS